MRRPTSTSPSTNSAASTPAPTRWPGGSTRRGSASSASPSAAAAPWKSAAPIPAAAQSPTSTAASGPPPEPATFPRPVLLVAAEPDKLVRPCAGSVRAGLFSSPDYCAAFHANASERWQSVHDHARPSQAALIQRSRHPSFLNLPLADAAPLKPALAAATIDSTRMRHVVCALLIAFFATHLNGEGAPPDGPSHPEIAFGATAALFPTSTEDIPSPSRSEILSPLPRKGEGEGSGVRQTAGPRVTATSYVICAPRVLT